MNLLNVVRWRDWLPQRNVLLTWPTQLFFCKHCKNIKRDLYQISYFVCNPLSLQALPISLTHLLTSDVQQTKQMMSKQTHNTSSASSPGPSQGTALPKPSLKGYLFGQLVGKGTFGYCFRATKVVSWWFVNCQLYILKYFIFFCRTHQKMLWLSSAFS